VVVIKTQSNQAITSLQSVPSEVVTCPFTVVRDDRERRAGWDFSGMTERRKKKDYQLIVPIREQRLETGDYTIDGMESLVTIERKSLSDAFGSCVGNKTDPERRNRFKREHERMQCMIESAGGFACVIIEASFPEVWESPPIDSGANPNSILGTMFSWQSKYRVPWYFGGSRRGAEIMCFRWLRAAWERLKDRNQMRLFD